MFLKQLDATLLFPEQPISLLDTLNHPISLVPGFIIEQVFVRLLFLFQLLCFKQYFLRFSHFTLGLTLLHTQSFGLLFIYFRLLLHLFLKYFCLTYFFFKLHFSPSFSFFFLPNQFFYLTSIFRKLFSFFLAFHLCQSSRLLSLSFYFASFPLIGNLLFFSQSSSFRLYICQSFLFFAFYLKLF